MTLKEKLQKAWENREKIAEGLFYNYLSTNKEVQEEILRRKTICESNVCGHYDAEGKGDNVVIPGKPACGVCGCMIPTLPASLSSTCSLVKLGQQPLWEALMTEAQVDQMEASAQSKREAYEKRRKEKREK